MGAEALYRAHAAFVACFLRRMGVLASDLDDLVQDVFIVAHRRGGYRPGPARPRTWLAAIAFRVARSRRRTRVHATTSPEILETLPDESQNPAEAMEAQFGLQRITAALERLSEEHSAPFILYELEGASCESIAALWEVPIGTVYARLHHARRLAFEAYHGNEAVRAAHRRRR